MTGQLIFCASLLLARSAVEARAAQPAACRDADLVARHGKIISMDGAGRILEALAVRDGKILATGSDAEIAACAAPRTRSLELEGRSVLPGLIDVHTHAHDWAKGILLKRIEVGYPGARSIADVARKVGERAAEARPGEWLIGEGWDESKMTEGRYLSRRDLDLVSPRNPVYLVHVSGHLAVANSRALELAGITPDTKDPADGIIERDTSGEPTGIVKERASALIERLLPPDPAGLSASAARLASQKAAEVGLTTYHDIGLSPQDMRGYQEVRQQGWLRARVHMIPIVRNIEEAEQLARSGLATGFGDDWLKLGAVKTFADGGMGARTIAIYPPPAAGEPGNLGLLIWSAEDLQKAHRALAGAGWQLVTHAIGDRAMDQVLDSYAATMQALGLREPRFRIAHGGLSTPAIQKRLRELRVSVDGNPPFVYFIGSWFLKYGPGRVRWCYPGKSYFENGILAGAGSDVSVTPISPWWGIWAAVERRDLKTGEILAPEERLTVLEALTLYTRNGARIGFEESRKGSLEPGKLADFIVVDRDVLAVPVDELKDVRVLKTFIGGELVYER